MVYLSAPSNISAVLGMALWLIEIELGASTWWQSGMDYHESDLLYSKLRSSPGCSLCLLPRKGMDEEHFRNPPTAQAVRRKTQFRFV